MVLSNNCNYVEYISQPARLVSHKHNEISIYWKTRNINNGLFRPSNEIYMHYFNWHFIGKLVLMLKGSAFDETL